MKTIAKLVVAAAAFAAGNVSAAPVTYDYTGADFDPAPTNGAYTTSQKVTGSFTLAAPLTPGSNNYPNLHNGTDFVSYSFTDGIQTISNTNEVAHFYDNAMFFTNAAGDVAFYFLAIHLAPVSSGFIPFIYICGGIPPPGWFCPPPTSGAGTDDSNYAFSTGAGTLMPVPVSLSGSQCDGIYNGTFKGNINVASGQFCNYVSGSIRGNVTLNGGTLTLSGAQVAGNVQLHSGGTLTLRGTTQIAGNVQLNNGGTFNIGPGVTIGGNFQVQNAPAVDPIVVDQICGATVMGNLQFQNNGIAVQIGSATGCAGNTIRGNLQVQNNMAPITVVGNTVKGNLQCQGNTSITGSDNTAKQKQGQCAAAAGF
jgi:hypothetical protein